MHGKKIPLSVFLLANSNL